MNIDNCIAFAQDLIRISSMSGKEKSIVERITAEMRNLGFDEIKVDENGSAIGTIQGKGKGPTLLLDGHCDTVEITNPSDWSHNPFGGEIDCENLYGRGAADMKCALAAMIYAAGSIDRSQLAGSAVISATVVEELMEGISFKTVVDSIKPDFVIIGEATDLNINRAGRGRAEIKIVTTGKSAHSSSPHLGVNAVNMMANIIQSIEQIDLPMDEFLGKAQMVLTDIISEPYPGYSVIPNKCISTYDRRLLPGETRESVINSILAGSSKSNVPFSISIEQGEHQTYTGSILKGEKFFPAWSFPENHKLVQNAIKGLIQTGLSPLVSGYQFCTNAAYCAGVAGIPTVGFGPGIEGSAHIVNEFIPVSDLRSAAFGYKGIIESILSTR